MDLDDVFGAAELPPISVSTEDALEATVRRGRSRQRRRLTLTGLAAIVVLVGLVATTLSIVGREPNGLVTDARGPRDGSGSWRAMATSPLTPRDQGVAVWTGSEVVIVGGSSATPCPEGSDCVVALEPLADGAAYDPAADAWRTIADAPVAFVRALAVWTGAEVLVLADVAGANDVLVAYDPTTNSWTPRADPPDSGLRSMAWTGHAWAGVGLTSEPGMGWEYLPSADRWQPLPIDPLGDVSDRSIVWTGEELVVTASRFDEPGLPPNGLYQAVVLGGAGGWRPVARSDVTNNGGAWTAVGRLVVNPGTGPTGDDLPNATGGVLDVVAGAWRPLPTPEAEGGGHTGFEGRAGRWVVDDNRLLDPVAGAWHTVETAPSEAAPAVAAWTGTEVITWGGTIQQPDGAPDLVADGYAYRPPSPSGGSEPSVDAGENDPPAADARVVVELLDAPLFVEGWDFAVRVRSESAELLAERRKPAFEREDSGSGPAGGSYFATIDVPSGTVLVQGHLTIGPAGPPPSPDFLTLGEGSLCSALTLSVEPGEAVVARMDWATGCLESDDAPEPATSDLLPEREPDARGVLGGPFPSDADQRRRLTLSSGSDSSFGSPFLLLGDATLVDGLDGAVLTADDIVHGQRVDVWIVGCDDSAPPQCEVEAIRTRP
jgi:hypothetical protein